jgi:hypothetical protein
MTANRKSWSALKVNRSVAVPGESLLPPGTRTRDAAGVDMHEGQLDVPPGTVRQLVDASFRMGLAIRAVDSQGTVNAIFRIGRHLAARFAPGAR